MTLFEIGSDFKVLLNKDWLLTIPPFRRLIHRDKGSEGDYDGRKKFKAIKEFTFIYHMYDPRSPIENMDSFSRREKALQYAELKEKDIDADVLGAVAEYEELLLHSVPTLRLLRSTKGTLEVLTNYFDTVDFDAVDKQGKIKYTVTEHIKNVSLLGTLHKQIMGFEELVTTELKAQKTARGKIELGDREMQGEKRQKWEEGKVNPHAATTELGSQPDFRRLAEVAQEADREDNVEYENLQDEEDDY